MPTAYPTSDLGPTMGEIFLIGTCKRDSDQNTQCNIIKYLEVLLATLRQGIYHTFCDRFIRATNVAVKGF